jgi:hypothetical protein
VSTATPVGDTPSRHFPRAEEAAPPVAADQLLDGRRSERLRRHRRRRRSRIVRSALTAVSWTAVALAALICLAGLLLPTAH